MTLQIRLNLLHTFNESEQIMKEIGKVFYFVAMNVRSTVLVKKMLEGKKGNPNLLFSPTIIELN